MEELIKLVKEEAKKLREYATIEEKDRLNPRSFNGGSAGGCVYGQLTGNCTNERATELIKLCCEKVYHSNNGYVPRKALAVLNGKPEGKREVFGFAYFSPIEVLVQDDSGSSGMNNAYPIISYLKGETDELILNQ